MAQYSDSGSDSDGIDDYKALINTERLNEKYQSFKQTFIGEDGDDGSEEEEEEEEEDSEEEEKEEEVVKKGGLKREKHVEVSTFEKILKVVLSFVKKSRKLLIFIFLVIVNLIIINQVSKTQQTEILPSVTSFADISRSLNHLQYQINELGTKNKNRLNDFKNYIDLKFDSITAKFADHDKQLDELTKKNQDLLNKLESLELNDVDIGVDRIPVLLDSQNNLQVIPQFEEYLQQQIKSLWNNEPSKSFEIDYETFLKDHLDELLNDKIAYMTKDQIQALVSSQFQENKKKLIKELKQLVQVDDLPNRLVPPPSSSQSASKQQKNKVNYALSSNGARIINYLTSPTFKPLYKNSFLSFLSKTAQTTNKDSEHSPSPFIIITNNEAYWKSSITKGTQLAIKFLEPIYLTSIKYDHLNPVGALKDSAPRHLELYVSGDSNEDIQQSSEFSDTIDKFVKVGEYEYGGSGEQELVLPGYLQKHLIKGVLVRVVDNYGNQFFTSLYKFKIEGLTRFDVFAIQEALKSRPDAGPKSFGEDLVL